MGMNEGTPWHPFLQYKCMGTRDTIRDKFKGNVMIPFCLKGSGRGQGRVGMEETGRVRDDQANQNRQQRHPQAHQTQQRRTVSNHRPNTQQRQTPCWNAVTHRDTTAGVLPRVLTGVVMTLHRMHQGTKGLGGPFCLTASPRHWAQWLCRPFWHGPAQGSHCVKR